MRCAERSRLIADLCWPAESVAWPHPAVRMVAPVASFIAVFLLAMSFLTPKKNEIRDKLAPYSYKAGQESDRLSRPFSERVVFPLLESIGRVAGSTAPKQMQERFQQALDEA